MKQAFVKCKRTNASRKFLVRISRIICWVFLFFHTLAIEEIRSRRDDICDCLPPCSDTWYEPEISYASFPGRGFNRTSTYKRIERKHNIGPGTDITEYLK